MVCGYYLFGPLHFQNIDFLTWNMDILRALTTKHRFLVDSREALYVLVWFFLTKGVLYFVKIIFIIYTHKFNWFLWFSRTLIFHILLSLFSSVKSCYSLLLVAFFSNQHFIIFEVPFWWMNVFFV